MMNPDDRFFFVKFEEPTFINQRVIGLNRLNQADDINLIHALLNSILSLFYIEAVGFGRGLGALDVNKKSIDRCYMLNTSLLSEEQKKEIFSGINLDNSNDEIPNGWLDDSRPYLANTSFLFLQTKSPMVFASVSLFKM